MNSRYCLTFKSTFQPEKPKKLENYFFYVKIFDWDCLHLTAQTKETYFSMILNFVQECLFPLTINPGFKAEVAEQFLNGI